MFLLEYETVGVFIEGICSINKDFTYTRREIVDLDRKISYRYRLCLLQHVIFLQK